MENVAALEVYVVLLLFKSLPLFLKLGGEEGEGDLPSVVYFSHRVIQKPGLKEAAHLHFLNEMDDFFFVCDDHAVVAALDLAAIELAGKDGDMSVWCVAPGSKEGCFDCMFLLCVITNHERSWMTILVVLFLYPM